MFRIVPQPTFKADVQLTVPGVEVPEVVKFEFRHLDVRAYNAWADEAAKMVLASGEAADMAGVLHQVIVGWSGIGDADGKPIEYSLERLSALLGQYHAAGYEIATAYRKALRDARSKN